MANTTLQLKRSSVAGKTPTTGQIDTGELALNITDQKLYSSNGTGVFQLSGAEWDQQIKINFDSTTDPALLITSTNATSDASPELELYRNSASPDDGDYLGQLKFTGENDTGGKKVYAKITGKTSDVTNGTEDGLIEHAVHKNGSITIVSRQTSSDLKLLNGTGLTVNGSVTVDANLTADGAIDFGGSTDAILIPIGNTAQRPAAANGSFRYNTDDNQFEGYANGEWGAISSGITQNGLNPKNYIVNPGMRISQENGTSSSTASVYYPVDQWVMSHVQDGTLTTQQVSSATPGGSENRIRMTVTSADTSIAAGQYALFLQTIEGLRTADLQWGTANATDVVLRFGFKGPAGTYAVGIRNQNANRSFVREFTISGGDANTDTLQTVTFPGDTSGTWDKDNTTSFILDFTFAVGSNFQTTADAWQAGNYFGTSSVSNGIGTTSDVFELFDVGLYADPDSTGLAPRFELPHYDTDLQECQRYYRVQQVFTQSPVAGYMIESYTLGPNMRIDNWASSLTILGSSAYTSYAPSNKVKNGFAMQLLASGAGGYVIGNIKANARL